MRLEQEKLDIWLFKLLFLMAGGIVVTQTLGLESLTSYMFLLTFPVTGLLWARSVRKTLTVWDLLILLAVGMAVINVLINTVVTDTRPSFNYFKKMIMFVMTLVYLQACSRMQIHDKVVKFFNRLLELLIVYLILAFFILNIQMFMIGGRVSAYLTFRFNNPNLTGLFLTCLYMLEFPRLFGKDKWHKKLYRIVLLVALAGFVVLTSSRNSLLVMLLFTAGCIVLMLLPRVSLRMDAVATLIVIVVPVVFMAIYMTVVYNESIQNLFGFLVEEGKSLDSRIEIWEPALNDLRGSPIIGAYSQITGGTGAAQMHNTHLDIACSYGIPVLLVVCVLLFRWLNQRNQAYKDKVGFAYMLGFASTIIMGMGEAALFSGSLGLYILVGFFLLMANRGAKEDQPVELEEWD